MEKVLKKIVEDRIKELDNSIAEPYQLKEVRDDEQAQLEFLHKLRSALFGW